MNTKEFLNNVCKEIKYEPANKLITEELEGHIEDIKSEYLCKGVSEKEAEEKAVKQMGDAKKIGKKLNKMYGPQLDWKLLVLIYIVMFFGILSAATYFKKITSITNGAIFSNTMFQQYIFILALGTVLSGMIYYMDYKEICKYSLLIYGVGILLNIISFISDDARLEYLYATLPFYVISFAGFINGIDKKKRNIVKAIALGIISLALLRKVSGVALRYVAIAYLIMSTIKILKLKKNRFKYLAIIWIIPIIMLTLDAYERIYYMSINSEKHWMGMVNRKK